MNCRTGLRQTWFDNTDVEKNILTVALHVTLRGTGTCLNDIKEKKRKIRVAREIDRLRRRDGVFGRGNYTIVRPRDDFRIPGRS